MTKLTESTAEEMEGNDEEMLRTLKLEQIGVTAEEIGKYNRVVQ
jgi:hypothetical protein